VYVCQAFLLCFNIFDRSIYLYYNRKQNISPLFFDPHHPPQMIEENFMEDSPTRSPVHYPDVEKFIHRLQELPDGFFQPEKTIYVNRTPGRLDLMGGNDDYTGGLVFETTIQEATIVAVQPRADRQVIFYNPAVKTLGWADRIEFSLDDLLEGGQLRPLEWVRAWINSDHTRAWCAYILGNLYYLLMKFPEKVQHGFSLYLESEVPLGKGVSSSAALEVAPMKAIAWMYGIHVAGVELASWTQWVEIALTQSACGIMDQLTVVVGDTDAFVPMLCQPCHPYPLARLPQNLKVWGIDSGVRHAVSGIEYESARAATFMGYRYLCEYEQLQPVLDETGSLPRYVDPLWNGYLANLTPALFREKYEERLPAHVQGAEFNSSYPVHLDPFTPVRPDVVYPVRAATRYAVEENWRVTLFYAIISANNGRVNERAGWLLGELMYQAHTGYNDCGLGSAATDQIVSFVREEQGNGLLGAKITGGGAGGTVAVLGWNTSAAEQAFFHVVEKYRAASGIAPYIFRGSSPGSDSFGVMEISLPAS
jgi:galactokinase